jgi:hypothetical protein
MEELLGVFLEFLLGGISEFAFEALPHAVRALWRALFHAAAGREAAGTTELMFGYAIGGLLLGALSLWTTHHFVIANSQLRHAHFVVSPFVIGGAAYLAHQLLSGAHTTYRRFFCAAVFVLAFNVVRMGVLR